MRLVQAHNPDIILALLPWWHKYMEKVGKHHAEGELIRLASCFKPDSDLRLFVLVDDEGNAHGYCILSFDQAFNTLMIVTTSTDHPRELEKEVRRIADEAGAVEIIFWTERNPKAWQRLLGYDEVGHIMRLPYIGGSHGV